MKYNHEEILDILDASDKIEDIIWLAGLMHDYPQQFDSPDKYRRLIVIYSISFI